MTKEKIKLAAEELSDDLVGTNYSVSGLLEKFGQDCYEAGRKSAFEEMAKFCYETPPYGRPNKTAERLHALCICKASASGDNK